MKQQIEESFTFNLTRAANLVSVYDRITAGRRRRQLRGRRPVLQSDSLRAATVFIHATLEDLLRSISYWKLPAAPAAVLNEMALIGKETDQRKFSLGDLAAHRGKSVNTIIAESVNQHLERSSYNNTGEIAKFLSAIGVDIATVDGEFRTLQALMTRRHLIVHRADRRPAKGSGNHRASSIGKGKVEEWLESVTTFGTVLLEQL